MAGIIVVAVVWLSLGVTGIIEIELTLGVAAARISLEFMLDTPNSSGFSTS